MAVTSRMLLGYDALLGKQTSRCEVRTCPHVYSGGDDGSP